MSNRVGWIILDVKVFLQIGIISPPMVKIYTKTGDNGTTSLFGGKRVEKDSARIKAYGEVDELNSVIGVALTQTLNPDFAKKLRRVQEELFILGADLSTPFLLKVKIPRISKRHIRQLEKEIDKWEKELPKLRNFILPGGHLAGANLHLARSIARRAERAVVSLSKEEKNNPNCQIYLNRLSDWLFVAARYVNHLEKISETIWKGRK